MPDPVVTGFSTALPAAYTRNPKIHVFGAPFGVLHGGVRLSFVDGDPEPPCLEITGPSYYPFFIPVNSGRYEISVKTWFYEGILPRQSLFVAKNPNIGVTQDYEVFAPDTSSWNTLTIGPLEINGTGLLRIEFRVNNVGHNKRRSLWDHFTVKKLS